MRNGYGEPAGEGRRVVGGRSARSAFYSWLIAGLVLFAASGCGGKREQASSGGPGAGGGSEAEGGAMQAEGTRMVKVEVHGMHCEGCVAAIEQALGECDGVVQKEVSLGDSLAVVTYDPAKVKPADVVAVIEELGYIAKEKAAP